MNARICPVCKVGCVTGRATFCSRRCASLDLHDSTRDALLESDRAGSCAHCGQRRSLIGRGLCMTCYRNPAVRPLYSVRKKPPPGDVSGRNALAVEYLWVARQMAAEAWRRPLSRSLGNFDDVVSTAAVCLVELLGKFNADEHGGLVKYLMNKMRVRLHYEAVEAWRQLYRPDLTLLYRGMVGRHKDRHNGSNS